MPLFFASIIPFARAVVQPLIRMVVLCVQVFAAGGFAAAQVALALLYSSTARTSCQRPGARCCRRHWSFHTVLLLTPNTCAAARTVAPLCTRYRPICTARSSGSPFIEHALPTVFSTVCGAPSVYAGSCWRAGRRHGTIRSEQIFFSNAETLCPPGSLSQCKPCKNKHRRMPRVQHQNYYRG